DLPVPDDAFDRVLSSFGAMFATDQGRVAGEMRRACRPGGTVGVTAWAIDGLFDQMTETLRSHVADLPPDGPSPRDWGRAELLPAIFGIAPGDLTFTERTITWRVPSADAAMAVCEENAAPIIMLRQ